MGTRFASISGRLLNLQHRQKLIQFAVRHAHETSFWYLLGGVLEMFRRTPPVTFKEEYTSGVRDFSVVKIFNRPFYPYGGHIEFIRFKEYYGMPRGHSLSIYARFSGKKRTSLYISWEKGDHYYIQTRHKDLFSHYNLILRKL